MTKGYPLLDAARLLHDLQRVSQIAQDLGGLDARHIAQRITNALVEHFDCAFARMWLVEAGEATLRLVASSGLYTHIDGSFARVPIGAYKVGKIAQNQVPFLSNQLAEESWVKDRQWAIDNQIQGFAGYPLVSQGGVLGVLATFSHSPFAPEFLEVLQVLCMVLTVALDGALRRESGLSSGAERPLGSGDLMLSDQMVAELPGTRLVLVGRERTLPLATTYALLQAVRTLHGLRCSYCRLSYGPWQVLLEAIVGEPERGQGSGAGLLDQLGPLIHSLGGTLQREAIEGSQASQISVALPVAPDQSSLTVQVRCRQSLLLRGFTQLADQAGLQIVDTAADVMITDTVTAAGPTLWIYHGQGLPPETGVIVDLSTTPAQLRQLAEQVVRGEHPAVESPGLSSREQQVMRLLAEGKRDRNIAQELFISESTVKFHINNSLQKLEAKNRYQGVYQAAIRGWI